MILLDLFCGAGGAGVGYRRAGFDVVGVDLVAQPGYPYVSIRCDALEFVREYGGGFDAIHASPPCQRWTTAQAVYRDYHPDLITPLRPLLEATGRPWVIECVPQAPLRRDVVLCGTQFGLEADGFEIRRHRVFELGGWDLGTLVPPCQHRLPAMPIFGHGPNADFYERYGDGVSVAARYDAMGIDWMNRDELAEAIPPAYTELVGRQLLEALEREEVAA